MLNMKKRLFHVLLSIALMFSMIPTVFAEGNEATVVAKTGDQEYETLKEAVNAVASGEVVTLLADVALENEFVIEAGKVFTLDLNGKTISGTHASDFSLIHVHNGAELTVKDTSSEKNGKITYASGGNKEGATIWVEGKLIQESGIIELTGSWNLGFAVDVRPNAWGTAHTTGASFTMNDGTINSADTGVRAASNSSDAYEELGVTFTMNNGTIISEWDAVFVQHLYQGDLNINILNGQVSGTNSVLRIYGDAGSNVDFNVAKGTFTGVIKIADVYASDLKLSGGTYSDKEAENYVVDGYKLIESNGLYYVEEIIPVAKIGETTYMTLQEAVNNANGNTVVLLSDVNLGTSSVTIAKDTTMTLDLNGKTISGTHGQDYSMIHVVNGSELTVKDTSLEKSGKITYAPGGNNTGANIWVEGKLTLESGTIEVTGSWTLGFAVDVRPNAWSTAHTTGASFVMDGGAVKSTDTAVRVASNSSDVHEELGVTFTLNDGTIDSDWDAIFVQHLYVGDLNVNVTKGQVSGSNSVIRIYGDTGSDIDINVADGAFDGIIKVADAYAADSSAIEISGGTYTDGNAEKYVVEGYKLVKSGDLYTVEEIIPEAKVGETTYMTLQEAVNNADGKTVVLLSDVNLGTSSVTIAKDTTVIIDLAGFDITGAVSKTPQTGNIELIKNKGALTLTNSAEAESEISYIYTGGIVARSVSTICNEQGTLTVENNVTVVNNTALELCTANGVYGYAIDSLTNGTLGEAKVTIAGGKVKSNYMAIRQFVNSATDNNILIVTSGTIEAGRRAINTQGSNETNKAADTAVVQISGGTITGGQYGYCGLTQSKNVEITGGEISGEIYYGGTKGIITGGTYTDRNTEKYVAEGYKLIKSGDLYYVVKLGAIEVEDESNVEDLPKDECKEDLATAGSQIVESIITNNATTDVTFEADENVNLEEVVIDAIVSGKDITTEVVVVDNPTVSESDEQLIEEKLETLEDTDIALVVDITVALNVNGTKVASITELSDTITLTLVIPEAYRNENAEYSIITVHNGVVEVIPVVVDKTAWIASFEASKFSTYALTYTLEATPTPTPTPTPETTVTPSQTPTSTPAPSTVPNTSDNSNMMMWAGIAILSLLAAIATTVGRKFQIGK